MAAGHDEGQHGVAYGRFGVLREGEQGRQLGGHRPLYRTGRVGPVVAVREIAQQPQQVRSGAGQFTGQAGQLRDRAGRRHGEVVVAPGRGDQVVERRRTSLGGLGLQRCQQRAHVRSAVEIHAAHDTQKGAPTMTVGAPLRSSAADQTWPAFSRAEQQVSTRRRVTT